MKPVILLTGRPGVGKTTAVKKIVAQLGRRVGGFYTREIRGQGHRTGFEIVTLDGRTAWLASRSSTAIFKDEVTLGRYRVNLRAIDSTAVPAMQRALAEARIILIDEIGPMELASALFCQTVLDILAGESPVIGAIVERPHPFADRVKAYPGVQVMTITLANRNELPEQIVADLVSFLQLRSE